MKMKGTEMQCLAIGKLEYIVQIMTTDDDFPWIHYLEMDKLIRLLILEYLCNHNSH